MPPPPTSHTVSSCVRAMSACADASCQYTLTTVPLSHTRSRANAWSSLVRSAPSPSLCLLSTLTAHPLADRGCDAPPRSRHTRRPRGCARSSFSARHVRSHPEINIVTRCAYTLMRAHVPRVHSCADASLALCLAASATIVALSLRPIIDGSSSFSARYARLSRTHTRHAGRSMRARLCARPT